MTIYCVKLKTTFTAATIAAIRKPAYRAVPRRANSALPITLLLQNVSTRSNEQMQIRMFQLLKYRRLM